jgi:hypothetical protein
MSIGGLLLGLVNLAIVVVLLLRFAAIADFRGRGSDPQ